ncbi:phospholipase-like protein D1 [Calycina marina]|uniref:Phospholipase n=1 Tax=Calycina marina TaxID=1763456 RepID=A0A9P8CG31_9HELO|nr:phospholipase-like protein D1 [Calycina marina]
MEQRIEESILPMSQSPQVPGTQTSSDPTASQSTANGSTSAKLSDLWNEQNFNPPNSGLGLATYDDASDYMNAGVAHHDYSPHTLNLPSFAPNSSLSRLPSAIKKPPPHSNSFPRESPAPGGTSTPPGRRSVQFRRSDRDIDAGSSKQDDWGLEDGGDTPGKESRGQYLMSKLKALASTGGTHSRSQSNSQSIDEGTGSVPILPAVDRQTHFQGILQEEGSDVDADAEETADESAAIAAAKPRRKRRIRRQSQQVGESQTVPNTPRNRFSSQTDTPGGSSRPKFSFTRRATDGSLEQRGHVSEGEGQDRAGSHSAWRRGSSWMANGRNTPQAREFDGTPSSRRPSNFRRAITGMAGGLSDGDGPAQKRPFLGAERATTFGAQRWKMIKHGLKLLSKGKEEHKIDYMKSAELMAELRAGAPAALMLASMIQRDDNGNKRIPVILEQLKVTVVDSRSSTEDPEETERHLIFRIALEYGSGLNRMKWVIERSLRDFGNLHLRYKLQGRNDKYIQLKTGAGPKQPHFPSSAFPYFRGLRGQGISSDEDEADTIRADETAGEATLSDTEKRKKNKRRPSLSMSRRMSSAAGPTSGGPAAEERKKHAFNEKQRRKLEQYLMEMIRWLIFRADSNRLCRFLELSALGVRLAAEGSFHGKEGFLIIQSAKGLDMRKLLTPHSIFKRHSPKWFLVRHSYIVCVDSPENMRIYDVYLVDENFSIQKQKKKLKELGGKEMVAKATESAKHPSSHHSLKIVNSERKIKLLAKNERQLRQFEESITYMLGRTQWSKPNRFGSFAPVRTDVFAQWLVDGRDYMWNVSRAIDMAKDVIYIHDWWLSPQLYMRRPAAISQKWRLDRLLHKKAQEGVKVFIIIYRNVEAAIPIDSEFTKHWFLDLHPNIFVQRSPNQYKKNQFFFAHHEKICIVDHTVAFVGGIDLCFGRWDSPQHSVTDDKPTGFEDTDLPKDADHCQLWPGKDYSNPRVQDFFKLNEPYAEMYDRTKTPRMPWHDISMQVIGQPARDLTRHFVQRWNYVLLGRKPTRPTPFLLPPPDYNSADLEAQGITGTCEVQMLRSATDWSLGLTHVEHSIMTAYCKMIEESEHFVYMENQFFITSCETMGVKIVNKIGDALVERAIRAFEKGENWRCTVLIPLMPGFQNTVDEAEGTSVRLIMQCQFRSICRGEGSIFERLRSHGIEPEGFINFYSLRSWGRIGPKKSLVTEQLYIHAKVIIVDDRIALIGSANINERSMLGSRDSETAAVVRDTDMIHSTMGGEPYLVGRFAHTLRMRLMREHLGCDVDEIMEEERRAELDREQEDFEANMHGIYDGTPDRAEPEESAEVAKAKMERLATQGSFRSFNHDVDWEEEDNPNIVADKWKPVTRDKRVEGNPQVEMDVDGRGTDHWKDAEQSGVGLGRDSVLVGGVREVLVSDIAAEGNGTINHPRKPHRRSSPARPESDDEKTGNLDFPPMPQFPRRTTDQLGLSQLSQLPTLPSLDDTDIGGPAIHLDDSGSVATKPFNPLTEDIKQPSINKDCMRDPLNDDFEDTWHRVADNNTKIFRRVFRCNPDNEVQNWKQYQVYAAYAARFAQSQGSKTNEEHESAGASGPVGADMVCHSHGLSSISEKLPHQSNPQGSIAHRAANVNVEHDRRPDTSAINLSTDGQADVFSEKTALGRALVVEQPEPEHPVVNEKNTSAPRATVSSTNGPITQEATKRRRRGATRSSLNPFSASDDLLSQKDADELLSLVQGHLVVFPYNWLITEEHSSRWLYQVDQVAPLQIYN